MSIDDKEFLKDKEFAPFMLGLWKLAGEIGTLAERGDHRYDQISVLLALAIDEAERVKLIRYFDEKGYPVENGRNTDLIIY
jgi:hypothetical protein